MRNYMAYVFVVSGIRAMCSRDGAMAPVARNHNRCNYVWKFLIHPIMFDNNPAFHVNCQRFAAHELLFASSNFFQLSSHDKFANG